MLILYLKTLHSKTTHLSRLSSIRSIFSKRSDSFKTYLAKPKILKDFKLSQKHSLTLTSAGLFAGGYLLWCRVNSPKCESLANDNDEDTQNKIDKIYDSINKVRDSEDSLDWTKLWELLKPDTLYLIVAVASSLVVAFLNIQIPISLGSIINVLSRYANEGNALWTNEFFDEMKWPSIKLIELYLLQGFFTFIYISSLSIVGEKLASRLRQKLFNTLVQLDIEFYDTVKTGEIISRITTDVQEFKSSFKLCISQGIRNATQLIGCIISLFVISTKMTLMMATVLPCMVGIGSLIGAKLRQKSKEAQFQVAKATAIATEALGNIRTLKAFAMEEVQSRAYNKKLVHAEQINSDLGIGIGLFQGISNIALNGIVLGTLTFGGYMLSKDEMSAGNLMSFLVSTQTIQKSMAQLSLLFGYYIRGVSAGSRVFAFLELQPHITSGEIKLKRENLVGDIVFSHVKFEYPTRKHQTVLSDFNLRLLPGKVTAVCGLSGAGKSTIALLLERFYDVTSGSITIDKHDIKKVDLKWLRNEVIGFINQEPVLFGTTIMENIRMGKPDASDEEVYRAAQIANADSFIRHFPDGYQTLVGERGIAISGGQKQRIAIARAIIKNPSILILDEATSALDAESEAIVQEALEKVMKGRTVLVIAHRLSTIQNADVIAVIANGKVSEIGNHSSLKKLGGIYLRLIKQQSDSLGVE